MNVQGRNPLLIVDNLKGFFDRTSDYYDSDRNSYLQKQRAKILKNEIIGPNVLDIGINAGNLLRQYCDLRSDIQPYGVDFSLNCIRKALLEVPACRFVCADGENLCFKKYFQTVLCCETIYYMKDPLRCIEEIYCCLSDNGKVTIISSSPLLTWLVQVILVPFKLWPKDISGIRTFSARYISRLLAKAGFGDIRCRYYNFIPFKGWEFTDNLVLHKFGTFSVVTGVKK